jgi:diguanylate cyclase (GGDEF)-like protein
MSKFTPQQKKKSRFDIVLIILFNVIFGFFAKYNDLLELLQTHHLEKLIPVIISLLLSCLYYAVRRWFEYAKLSSSAEIRVAQDSLTKLYNRRTLESKLLLEWQRFNRYKEPFCLIMIHIDDLKLINDSFGHKEGDRIIIEVSEKLLNNTRKTDFCARWSGTEFLIFCPSSKLQPIAALAERLRADVYCLLKDGIELTISLGVSEANNHKSLEELLKKVELKLYKAKKTGGNCVVSD